MEVRPDVAEKSVLAGRIVAAHGIRGEVRIESYCADPLDIAAYGPLATERTGLVVEIASVRAVRNGVVARLRGVSDRNGAEALKGCELYIARSKLPPGENADEFYFADLVGLAVRLGDGSTIGRIYSVEDYGAGAVVEIALQTGASALYAFTKANFPDVSVEGGYVVLDPPNEIELHE